MDCPHCTKEVLIALEFNEIEVDYCTACKGVWLDAGELELILGDAEKTVAFLSLGSPATVPDGETTRECPECDQQMTKEATQGEPPVIFDHCPNQHGLWLDAGELDTILDQMESIIGEGPVGEYLRALFSRSGE